MEKDLALGPEAKAALKIADGKVSIGVDYVGKQASASAVVSLDVEQFAQLLKDAIPGKIDDTVIDLLVAAMKAI
jgi:hypothetical protein